MVRAATVPPVPVRQVAPNSGTVSSGDLAGLLSGRPCDPLRFRALYPDRWSAFLRAHFQSATHVSVFFEVDNRCARNWWEGTSGPQGWAVEFAIRSLPAAAQYLRAA